MGRPAAVIMPIMTSAGRIGGSFHGGNQKARLEGGGHKHAAQLQGAAALDRGEMETLIQVHSELG